MNSASYKPHFTDLLQQAGVSPQQLPATLQILIEKFGKALQAWKQGGADTQKRLLPALAQTDAVIASSIFQLYKDRMGTQPVDKKKLMAMKAKALQLKWKLAKQ